MGGTCPESAFVDFAFRLVEGSLGSQTRSIRLTVGYLLHEMVILYQPLICIRLGKDKVFQLQDFVFLPCKVRNDSLFRLLSSSDALNSYIYLSGWIAHLTLEVRKDIHELDYSQTCCFFLNIYLFGYLQVSVVARGLSFPDGDRAQAPCTGSWASHPLGR